MENLANLKTIMIGKSYQDRFEIWRTILDKAEIMEFNEKCQVYTEYVQEFPFTLKPWNYLAQLYANSGENDKAFQIYEWGLQMNKCSWKLWDSFCSWVESAYQDPDVIRRVYDNAINCVGRDYHSGSLWERYINFEEKQGDFDRLNNLFWRLAMLPQKTLEGVKLRYKNFIENIVDINIITKFSAQMNFLSQNSSESNPSIDILKSTLIAFFDKVSEGTGLHAKNRATFEEKLKQNLYEGKPIEQNEKNIWINYINYEKSVETETHSNVLFVLEKAITYLCASSDIWKEYIEYVDKSKNSHTVLIRFLSMYRTMLNVIDVNLVFYESDLNELLGNYNEARHIYRTLAYYQPTDLHINMRMLQLEMRLNDDSQVRAIFENLIKEKSYPITIKVYIVQNYVKFLENRGQTGDCLLLLESLSEKLGYDRLIVGLYLTYLLRHENYETSVTKGLYVYEGLIKHNRDTSDWQGLANGIKLYKSFLRSNCMELGFIRKIEALISRRQIEYEGKVDEDVWGSCDVAIGSVITEWQQKLVRDQQEAVLAGGINGSEDPDKEFENGMNVGEPTELKKRLFTDPEDQMEMIAQKKLIE